MDEPDPWRAAAAYEAYVGRWSSLVARRFAVWLDVPAGFAGFEDCWTPFLGGAGPAPAYVATLGEQERTVLREGLRRRLPVADDGSVHLTARAWAVRARRP